MRSKSSDRWLKEHVADKHVKQALTDGYRSRAVYKLIALNEKDSLFSKGDTVLELGAAPGGWTQYVAEHVGATGRIVATDILEMDGFTGVTVIRGDFTDNEVADQIESAIGAGADAVLSDMAPNLSGVAVSDQARAMGLADLALEMAQRVLKADGVLVVKLFQGEGFDDYMQQLRQAFKSVKVRKPDGSRARSREIYAVARNLI